MLSMSKMSKIDQKHLRAVMLSMSKMSKMGKEHTDTFVQYVTPKGCNAMYVEDVEDCICSLYATLHTELLILLLMSKVSKMLNTMNN